MELVIVPAWRRAGFLAACLRRLALVDDSRLRYWITLDRGYDVASAQVAAEFVRGRRDRVQVTTRWPHPYAGNSFNVLSALEGALELDVDLIHLIEEDVFVSADYFRFHRTAHRAAPEAFAVSACRNQNRRTLAGPDEDPGAIYLDAQYQSLGVSFRPRAVSMITEAVGDGYFADPVGYCRRTWPRSRIPAGHAEQDGLINRIVEAGGGSVAYPCVPRAYHAGFVGYHRAGDLPPGTPQQQADAILDMSSEDLNAAAHATYRDHEAVALDIVQGPVTHLVAWQ